jgi:hypothetical protein
MHLLQDLETDDFSRKYIASMEGTKKSAFPEAINTPAWSIWLMFMSGSKFRAPQTRLAEHGALGDLVAIDDSLKNVVLSHGLGRLPPRGQEGQGPPWI